MLHSVESVIFKRRLSEIPLPQKIELKCQQERIYVCTWSECSSQCWGWEFSRWFLYAADLVFVHGQARDIGTGERSDASQRGANAAAEVGDFHSLFQTKVQSEVVLKRGDRPQAALWTSTNTKVKAPNHTRKNQLKNKNASNCSIIQFKLKVGVSTRDFQAHRNPPVFPVNTHMVCGRPCSDFKKEKPNEISSQYKFK